MTKSEKFVKAHQMTKEIKAENPAVNYRSQFGICLSYICKEGEREMEVKKSVEEKLVELGYKVWKKGDNKRVYINNLMELAEKLNVELLNPKSVRKDSMYFDCITEKFTYSVSSSRKYIVEELIEKIRA